MKTIGGGLALATLTAFAFAQTAERRVYAASPELRRDLEAHDFDVGQVEGVVNGIVQGIASGDLGPILDRTAPNVRVTDGVANRVIPKTQLGAFGDRLLKTATLERAVMDESQVIVRGDEIGLAGGEIWVAQSCAAPDCSEKKSSIVTINLP